MVKIVCSDTGVILWKSIDHDYVSWSKLYIMIWGYMSIHGVGRLAFVEGNMD